MQKSLILMMAVIGALGLIHARLLWMDGADFDHGSQDVPELRGIVDAAGREVMVPWPVERVVASGAGALRLLVYLQAHDRVVGVDSIELQGSTVDVRPYALANPQFKKLPLIGEFRGRDNPELILGLNPQPQVVFKTFASTGMNPDLLQQRIGIPVVVLNYGDLGPRRHQLEQALRMIGEIMDRRERAEQVIAYFAELEKDLRRRTVHVGEDSQSPVCYVGGIAMRGPLGLNSTEPNYPPFRFLGLNNVASDMPGGNGYLSHAMVAREQLVDWDPEVIFLDLAMLSIGSRAGGLSELRQDPAYHDLRAVRDRQVFGVLPYNSYAANFGSILGNAYFVGKVIYPEAFADINLAEKVDEIYRFLVGEPVFEAINRLLQEKAFSRLLAE